MIGGTGMVQSEENHLLVLKVNIGTHPSHGTADQFLEADTQLEVEGVMERVVPGERHSVKESIECDDSLAVCTDLDCEHWEAYFLTELGCDSTGGNDRIDEVRW